MRSNAIFLISGFILAFLVGYLLFGQKSAEEPSTDHAPTEEQASDSDEAEDLVAMIPDEAEVLSRNSCLGCHAVESLGASGGTVGPDLSRVYAEMEDKHGKDLDEFLQDPTSAVMATVIEDRPLKDEEREEIVKVLKEASERYASEETSDETETNNEDEVND